MKHFLHLFFAGSAILFLNCTYGQKPNILWLSIEDTSPQFIGCYGNSSARTPVIDALAASGVRFTSAFSTATVCAPTRFSIITGVRTYEAGTGHHRSAYPIPEQLKGFPSYMKSAGYYTSNNVKTDYNTAAAQRIISESWNENSNRAGWWNRVPGQPFFSVFNFMESHQSRTMTNPYNIYKRNVLDKLPAADQISDQDVDMPPFYKDSPEMRKQVARIYNSLKLTDRLIGEVLDRLKKDKLMDSTIIFFFGDHGEGMPRAKTNGIGLGYRVPFVIWFPPMYQHLSPWKTGVVTDELVNFEDLAPTLLSLAGIKAPGYMKGRAIAGAHRAAPAPFVFGSSDRSDESTDLVRSVTDGRYLYSRNYMSYIPENRWIEYQEVSDIKKQIRNDYEHGRLNEIQRKMMEPRPAVFLFDLKNDPWELHNLADEKRMQPVVKRMSQALDENIIRSRDILFLPEVELSAISVSGNPYDFRLTDARYPLKRIYAAARLSGYRDAAIAAQQARMLDDKNNIVRYWAAMGLRSQTVHTQRGYQQKLEHALGDPYTPVRILAAAILYDLNNEEKCRGILQQCITGSDKDLALLALQQVAYLSKISPFTEAIESVNKRGRKDDFNLYAATQVLLDRLGKKALTLDN